MSRAVSELLSFVVLLGGPLLFGAFGKPAEAGVAMLAGAIGLAFANLDRIKRFKGGGFEAEMREQFEALVAKESEPEEEAVVGGLQVSGFSLDEKTRNVVLALNSSQYTWRSLGGVGQEAKLSRNEVKSSLDWLESNGLAMRVGSARKTNWGLTETGRDLANSIIKTSPLA